MCLEANPFCLDFTNPEERFIVIQQRQERCGFPAGHYEVLDRGSYPRVDVLARFEEHKTACRYAHELKAGAYATWSGTYMGEHI